MFNPKIVHKTRVKEKRPARTLSYLENSAYGLMAFAEKDRIFVDYLYHLFIKQPSAEFIPVSASKAVALLMPADRATAERRADWMYDITVQAASPGAVSARRLLAAWAADFPNATLKPLIVGIVGMAIPGITLGLIKKHARLPVIIRADLAVRAGRDLAESVLRASHEVVKNALLAAGGEAGKLEPELADWFFGERKPAFYRAPENDLALLKKEVASLKAPFGASAEDGRLAVLAVTPAFNLTSLAGAYKLESF